MADTYKVLGQAQSVANTVLPLYTVPASTSVATSHVSILNAGSASSTYSLYAVPSSEYESILTVLTYSWTQLGADIDGEAANDLSGWENSVSLSSDGTVVAIGAIGNDGTASSAGHVRVYAWSGSAWVQRGADIDGEAASDTSGRLSLNSDGTVVAIGATGNDGSGINAGHVRVYAWSGSAWVQRGSDIDGEAASDESGWSVSLSSDGTVVAIGAINNDGTASNAGHVRVYAWSGSAWVQRGSDIDGEGNSDFSGRVSLNSDGTVVAIGATSATGAAGPATGHVRVYAWSGSAWVQRGSDIDGEAAYDASGYSVSLNSDGTVVAIGAPGNAGTASNAGHVRVYAWSGSAWVQRGADINGEAEGDQSGYSVSLSSDGTVVAIGANWNDGTASNAGHVRVYAWSGSAWVQRGADIDGEAASDESGYSLSLSSDGTTVAIGAPRNDGSGNNAGHVRVYRSVAASTLISPASKHTIIKSKAILVGEHHEITGGMALSAGDVIAFSGVSASLVANIYGVEIS